MGWGSGSELFSRLIRVTRKHVSEKEKRVAIYREMIEAFRDSDWDTEDECQGEDPAFDEALAELG